jgi:hypothetical protein
MKQAMCVFMVGSLVAATATMEAAERRVDRQRVETRGKPRILLAAAMPRLLADVDYDYESPPPPAPGSDAAMAPRIQPVPESAGQAIGGHPIAMGSGASLYPCVKYRDRHNIAPCAVPMCVSIPDPCACKSSCCGPPKCVMVQICVPPCGCPRISCHHGGKFIKYDYGKYAVKIRSTLSGVVVVNYDD